MKASNKKEIITNYPHPRENSNFIGHKKATETLLKVLNSDKIPQSWLFCGPKGIGKASLAYHFARSILEGSKNMFGEKELFISPESPTFQRILHGSHSDLLVIEPDPSSASLEIKVDEIRKINDFLRLTSSETKHRIVIIDSADDMNTNAANALLKLLEEPPANALFLLVTHCPGKLLPTIKSRCRKLNMQPLSTEDSINVIRQSGAQIAESDFPKLMALAENSPGVAIKLHESEGIKIYDCIIQIIMSDKAAKPALVQKLSTMVSSKDNKEGWVIMALLLQSTLTRIIRNASTNANPPDALKNEEILKNQLLIEKPLEQLIKIWDKITYVLSNTERVNLDKRAVLISIFEDLG